MGKKQKRRSHRWMTYVLCFLMAFTMMPTSIFATDAEAEGDTGSSNEVVAQSNADENAVVEKEATSEAKSTEVTTEVTTETAQDNNDSEQAEEETSVEISEDEDADANSSNAQSQILLAADGPWEEYNHIDVRVDAKLTLVTKVNGKVIKSETVNVTTSNLYGNLNGNGISFYRKSGQGTENEWRCDNLWLNPWRDTVTINCTLSGRTSSGQTINVQMNNTYIGYNTLKRFIDACPAHNGYDIDYEAEQVSEEFTVDKTVTKVWEDNDSPNRPESVQIQLYADGVAYGDPVTLSDDNNWTASYTDLPKYSSGDKEVNYTVDELSVPEGYTKSINGMTITNKLIPETTTISGTKTWKDEDNWDRIRPKSITVNLYNGYEKVDSQTVTAEDNWSYSFKDVPKYDDNYKEIKYTVKESEVEGYTATYNGYDIVNTHVPEKVSLKLTKVWDDSNDQDGLREDSVQVQIYANGRPASGEGAKVTLSEENGWTATVKDLPKYYNGDEIEYSVKEITSIDGYTAKVTGDVASGFTITNSHTPETTVVSGTKTWKDEGNESERPKSITVNLLKNGEKIDSKTVTAADDWSYSFEGLAKYDKGDEINYSVTEDSVTDYSAAYDGYDIYNTYTPGKTSVTVSKKWNDSGDLDGSRPDHVVIQLYANGEAVDGKTLILNEDNNWTASFTDLNVNKAGEKVDYTVQEETVIGYTAAITGNAEVGYVVTNTHQPDIVPDDDDDDNDGATTKTTVQASDETPKTGDSNMMGLWVVLLLAAGGAVTGTTLYRRRSRN